MIAYSLGNFAWHPRYGITGETGVLEISFDGSYVEGYRFHPHILDDRGGATPIPSGERYDRIVDVIEGRCEQHDPGPLMTSEATGNSAADVTPSTAAE